MTIIFRASIECNVQRSVKCHGVIGAHGDHAALPQLALAAMERKGWRRIDRMDVCPACAAGLAGLAEHQPAEGAA